MQSLYKMGDCWFEINLCTKLVSGRVFHMKPNFPVQSVRNQPLKKSELKSVQNSSGSVRNDPWKGYTRHLISYYSFQGVCEYPLWVMQVWNKSSISQDRGQLLYTCSILLSVVGSASKVQGTMIGLLFLGSEADDCWGEEAFALTTSDELPVGSCVEMLLLENASFISSSKKPSVPKISSPMVVVSSLPQAINPYFWWHSTWKRQKPQSYIAETRETH